MTAPAGVITRIWRVNRETAERFLSMERQPKKGEVATNRKWSPGVVNEYAFEMLSKDKNGKSRWGFSHEGFAFIGKIDDGTAELKDGGQRCRALIQACTIGATNGEITLMPDPDFSFQVMVTEGLDEDSWRIMNIGRRRTVGDFLQMDGETHGFLLASVIQLCHAYEKTSADAPYVREHWVKGKMSPSARSEYLDANPGIRDAVAEGARAHRFMTVSAASAGYYLATKAGVKPELLHEFMDSLVEGTGRDWTKGNPILRLREMLANARGKRRTLPREDQLALFIKAFNAFAAGEEVRSLAFKSRKASTGAEAEKFPRFIAN